MTDCARPDTVEAAIVAAMLERREMRSPLYETLREPEDAYRRRLDRMKWVMEHQEPYPLKREDEE